MLNPEQLEAYNAILEGQNVFLTGQAGTGKSYLIAKVKEEFEARGRIVAITSTTGVSALLVGGTTIHRWAGIRQGELDAFLLLQRVRRNRNASQNWTQTSLLIIDEISMMSPDLLDKLEFIGREMRGVFHEPFGGMQVVLCGDFCQLPPVPTDVCCFEASSWNCIVKKICYLKINMRQDDPDFQEILAEIRMGIVSDKAREMLNSRIGAEIESGEIRPTKLMSHRKSVETINSRHLSECVTEDNKRQRFKAVDFITSERKVTKKQVEMYSSAMNKACQAPKILDLAVGAQVMLIANLDIDAGLVNGSRGAVIRFEEHRPVVLFRNGIEMIIQVHEWDMRISSQIKITRRQIPLILAWACTIHKAQGSTIDLVEVDLGDTIFAPGQFYTALSRVRSLKRLRITNLDLSKVIVKPEVEEFYNALE